MFNWAEQPIKGRLQAVTIEFESATGMSEGGITGDVDYQLGYMDGADFILIRNCTLPFDQNGVIAIVEAIQGTTTPSEAKAAVEALLVDALANASSE